MRRLTARHFAFPTFHDFSEKLTNQMHSRCDFFKIKDFKESNAVQQQAILMFCPPKRSIDLAMGLEKYISSSGLHRLNIVFFLIWEKRYLVTKKRCPNVYVHKFKLCYWSKLFFSSSIINMSLHGRRSLRLGNSGGGSASETDARGGSAMTGGSQTSCTRA